MLNILRRPPIRTEILTTHQHKRNQKKFFALTAEVKVGLLIGFPAKNTRPYHRNM